MQINKLICQQLICQLIPSRILTFIQTYIDFDMEFLCSTLLSLFWILCLDEEHLLEYMGQTLLQVEERRRYIP